MALSLVLSILMTLPFSVHAVERCADLLTLSTQNISIEVNQVRPLVFTNTEVLRRNNDIGQQQVGEVRLEKWFELPPYNQGFYNFVGIADDGRVYHIVDWEGQRRIARLLSGHHQMTQLALVEGEILFALDSSGQVFVYSPELWKKSPRGSIIKQAFLVQGALFVSLNTILYQITPQSFDAQFLPLLIGSTGLASSLQAAFWALFKYEKLNTFPDGFQKVPWQIEKIDDLARYADDIVRISQDITTLSHDMKPIPTEDISLPVKEASEHIR